MDEQGIEFEASLYELEAIAIGFNRVFKSNNTMIKISN